MSKNSTALKIAFAFLFVFSAFTIKAQGVIFEDVPFTPGIGEVYEFTPSQSGTLTVEVDSYPYYMWMHKWSTFLYGDEALGDPIYISSYVGDDESAEYNFLDIEAGKTYYFAQDNYEGNVSFTFIMKDYTGESIVSVFPSTENIFNYVNASDIQIYSSSSISSIGGAFISYDGKNVPLVKGENYGLVVGTGHVYVIMFYGYDFLNTINNIANAGAKEFTLTVHDVMINGNPVTVNDSNESGVEVNDGIVSVTYQIAPAPNYSAEDSIWPDPFYSYWEPGDENGMAVLKFDEEVASVTDVSLVMGKVAAGDIIQLDTYDMLSKCSFTSNKLIIDFTGEERMSNSSVVTVIVAGVMGKNGVTANMSSTSLDGVLFQYLDYTSEPAPGNPEGEEPGDGPSSVKALGIQRDNSGEVYTVTGQKVNAGNLGKGIYIINGKKVILK